MNKSQLIEYCKSTELFTTKSPSKTFLEATVSRAYDHQSESDSDTCFGNWANEDMSCMTCDFQEDCFEASIGIKRKDYFKEFEKEENPKIRFTSHLRKTRKSKSRHF